MKKNKGQNQTSAPNFSNQEEEILSFWKKNKIFEKSLAKNKSKKFISASEERKESMLSFRPSEDEKFIFFEGPPTANGKPGIHHVLARIFKDLIPRYKTMQGFQVERKAGWDTQGLPVELEVEKKLGFSGKQDIEKYGVAKFNQKCKESVWRYKKEWEKLTQRIGFWIDLEHPYITYENNYIETLWWIIKQIWEQKLLYQDYKVVPYCPRCGTALSSHELAQGYKENTEDPSIYVKFKLKEKSGRTKKKKKTKKDQEEYFLAWTTTPWTLPGNVALAVDEKINYVKVENKNQILILAEDCLPVLKGKYKVLKKIKGKSLLGKEYEPLYNFIPFQKKAHYVVPADFVTTSEGTGIVHTAVMYGADDFELGKKFNLPNQHLVDLEGKFIKDAGSFAGLFVKKADPRITSDLKERKLLYDASTIQHTYPFCWRCDTPLLYYAKTSWFIKVTKVKKKLIENNQAINWIPAYIKEGRFGEWLDEVKDWALSRERYWGTPLPIWECQNKSCSEKICIGSFKELKAQSPELKARSSEFDPHRPFIDEVTFSCKKCQTTMKRTPEVIDTWFDSGAMPFAQWHYPFENKKKIDQGESFPADYISEAIDQTRGWFYTLLAIATVLKKGTPYRNVICLGLILDKNGQKMSKSRGNVVNPWEVIDRFGADALRWYLYTLNQPGEAKNFDQEGPGEVLKKQILILWNVFLFLKTFVPHRLSQATVFSHHLLDHWIIARLNSLIGEITEDLDHYHITEAGRKIEEFIQDLSTWYLRRSRERFKKEKKDPDRLAAESTLFEVLAELSKLLAPFMPFLAESLFQELKAIAPRSEKGWSKSVHLEDWPTPHTPPLDKNLIKEMERVRKIVELAHAARAQAKIKVRQPLSQLVITSDFNDEFSPILKKELNVKEIVKVDLKKTGSLPHGKDWVTKSEGNLQIALDITLTDELVEEGNFREITRQINNLRRKAGLTINDKIKLYYQSGDPYFEKLLDFFHHRILKETIADSLSPYLKDLALDQKKELQIMGKKLILGIKKV